MNPVKSSMKGADAEPNQHLELEETDFDDWEILEAPTLEQEIKAKLRIKPVFSDLKSLLTNGYPNVSLQEVWRTLNSDLAIKSIDGYEGRMLLDVPKPNLYKFNEDNAKILKILGEVRPSANKGDFSLEVEKKPIVGTLNELFNYGEFLKFLPHIKFPFA